MNDSDLILKKFFPTREAAATEMINLRAILSLPKGTEHFLSDLHGEYQTFNHLIRNASGVIKHKIFDIYSDTLKKEEMDDLATLIYYPKEELKLVKIRTADIDGWYKTTLLRLVEIARITASKYTRSKVRKALPKTFEYILDELIHLPPDNRNKEEYYSNIIGSIIELKQADNFIVEISNLIQRLAIDRLHIVGDVFDRGEGADVILDTLSKYHAVDVQWGNHDVLWMGAHFGNYACICNVVRINCRYNNLHILENAYGINLRRLADFAGRTCRDKDLAAFAIKGDAGFDDETSLKKMHMAITLLQFKAEEELIRKHPEFGTPQADKMKAAGIDPRFTDEERQILSDLKKSFTESARLTSHVNFLLRNGSLYKVFNGNLLMHGCLPSDEDGSFTEVRLRGKKLSGKALCDALDSEVRAARHDAAARDLMWWLWCGKDSPLYGRNVMATFEKYFDPKNFREEKNAYYSYIKHEGYCKRVLAEFGLPESGHIINGHMPVKVKDGENPVSANGRHITIDGGLSRAYHTGTGIAGYTLISNSVGLILVSHSPFSSKENAILSREDVKSSSVMIEQYPRRMTVGDTDTGAELERQIAALANLY